MTQMSIDSLSCAVVATADTTISSSDFFPAVYLKSRRWAIRQATYYGLQVSHTGCKFIRSLVARYNVPYNSYHRALQSTTNTNLRAIESAASKLEGSKSRQRKRLPR